MLDFTCATTLRTRYVLGLVAAMLQRVAMPSQSTLLGGAPPLHPPPPRRRHTHQHIHILLDAAVSTGAAVSFAVADGQVVTNTKATDGNGSPKAEVYVLYHCGSPRPTNLPAGAKVFEIPLRSVSTDDTSVGEFMVRAGSDYPEF